MRKIAFAFLLVSMTLYSQEEKSTKMGQITLEELKMTTYEKDTTANAVVLYEHGNFYTEPDKFKKKTDYYFRIKIFNKKAFDLANITVNLYKERYIKNIKATTYNFDKYGNIERTHLLKENIYKVRQSENFVEARFTLPNIKEGSVIEYSYSVVTDYSNIYSWYFQSDIPKIKSEFDVAALGNYQYDARLTGFLKLDKDNPSIKENCLYMPGVGNGACSIYSYGMNDVPAFKEEAYMTSKENFIAHVSFDLKSFTSVRGERTKYTTTWKKAEGSLKKYFFNGQTAKKSYFKKNLPQNLLSNANTFEKAKNVYSYIQNHFNWNERYWDVKNVKIRKAFKEKTGGVDAINLSLYNSLQAADIESYLTAISTRDNGFPTKLYPVLNDFNYVIVKAVIDGKDYFLDATDKLLPFGLLPKRCLNGEGRVLDFKKGSYWQQIKAVKKTATTIKVQLSMDEVGDFSGKMSSVETGYSALKTRQAIISNSKEKYLENLENVNTNLLIDNYKNENLDNLEKPLKENFTIQLENDLESTDNIRINPFIIGRTKENPFKLKERDYPVDFAYPRKYTYHFSIKIPDTHNITKIPNNKAIKLPNNGGSFVLRISQKEQQIQGYLKFNIHRAIYSNVEYYYLKEFYKQLIEAESSFIEVTKKNQ